MIYFFSALHFVCYLDNKLLSFIVKGLQRYNNKFYWQNFFGFFTHPATCSY